MMFKDDIFGDNMFKDDMFGDDMFGDNAFGDDMFAESKVERNNFEEDTFGNEDIFGNSTSSRAQVKDGENEKFDKKCSDTEICGSKFKLSDLLPGENTCPVCGSSLIDLTEEDSQPAEDTTDSNFVLGDVLTIDKYGYLHIIDSEEEHRYEGRDRLKININGRVYKCECIMFDEYTLGRNSTTFCPDIDLSKIDFENRISRKHLMIYRDEDQFYVRNLSSKNTVHINETLLACDESMVLNDKDKILLSNFIECEFEKAPQEGELINNVG